MLKEVLRKLAEGKLSLSEAERMVRAALNVEVVDSLVRLDVGREARRGVPEVILASGKPLALVVKSAAEMARVTGRVIVSKAEPKHAEELAKELGEGFKVEFYENAKLLVAKRAGLSVEGGGGKVGILAAGTADANVLEEVEVVAREMGCEVFKAVDVGVAGLTRLKEALSMLWDLDVDVVVVVAGREGALPSVVAGLVDVPVIGVPTSTGEGVGGSGLAALLSMLQSCSLGLAVVNVDGGVAAGVVAALIARRAARFRAAHRPQEA